MPKARVAITGIGVVSPAGLGAEDFWHAIATGKKCVRQIGLFDACNFPSRIAGQLPEFSARQFVPKTYRKSVKVMARDIEIAVAAAELGVRDAGLLTRSSQAETTTYDPKRVGCNIGAGLISTDLDELGSAVNTAVTDGKFDFKLWGECGMNNLTPLWLLKYLPNMLACHITIIHGAQGPSNTITCGSASGVLSVFEASRLVADGGADAVIAGGAESKLNPMGLIRQQLLGRLCTSRNDSPGDAARPFDAEHDGTVVGEGGGILVIENLEKAQSREARIYAELVGFGAACDPAGMDVTHPTAGSLDLAVGKAVTEAGITPDQLGLIVAQGSGVAAEDLAEQAAWKSALGEAATTVPTVAITGAIGSTFAGAGGLALATAALALQNQTVPPTVNYARACGEESLNLSAEPRKHQIPYAVVGGFSIAGQSGACVLKRYEP